MATRGDRLETPERMWILSQTQLLHGGVDCNQSAIAVHCTDTGIIAGMLLDGLTIDDIDGEAEGGGETTPPPESKPKKWKKEEEKEDKKEEE